MKRTLLSALAVIAIFSLGMMVGGLKSQPGSATIAVAAPVPAALVVPMPNRCPRIHEAVMALDHAMEDLNGAGHDFCGHKGQAMSAIRQARHDLHEAEQCDKCR